MKGVDPMENRRGRGFPQRPHPVSYGKAEQKTEERTEPSDVRLTYAPHTKILTLPRDLQTVRFICTSCEGSVNIRASDFVTLQEHCPGRGAQWIIGRGAEDDAIR